MTKKDIKAFFKAITDNDFNRVKALIDFSKEYLTVCNFAPPKKDDGQSGLQIAFKTGNFDIAKLLIEYGADINFIETSKINEWTAPVLHDCIRATIFNTYTIQKDTSRFDEAFLLLQAMLDRKVNPNSTDYFGNNCLNRAIMDAKQMIDNPGADLSDGILLEQLRKVFKALIEAGADTNLKNKKRASAESAMRNFRLEQYQLW
jgi:ankyrin repeat protein